MITLQGGKGGGGDSHLRRLGLLVKKFENP